MGYFDFAGLKLDNAFRCVDDALDQSGRG
jgi:hypothetical protein